jgi:probable rRNA maturation factor
MPAPIGDHEEIAWNEEDDHSVNFFPEDIEFELPDEALTRVWISKILAFEGKSPAAINYIFTSDAYLHRMNVDYLDHDTLTDVITFPYSESDEIEGDIFISIERIQDNAQQFGVAFEVELRRVMAHGVLHLCGYLDKTPEDKQRMSAKEDEAIRLWPEMSD